MPVLGISYNMIDPHRKMYLKLKDSFRLLLFEGATISPQEIMSSSTYFIRPIDAIGLTVSLKPLFVTLAQCGLGTYCIVMQVSS